MTLIDQIKEVMANHTGAAHINDIAKMLVDHFPNIQTPLDKLPSKVSAVLSKDAKKKGVKASFSRPKGKKKGSFKKGMYRLKNKPRVKTTPTLTPTVTNQYTGKAGETAVISELLFYGFNASAMAVDDGLDIIASKDDRYFHIQVKTSNLTESGSFRFSIKRKSFVAKDSSQTFYIFVLRQIDDYRNFNDYLIIPSSQVKFLVSRGIIADGLNYSVYIQKDQWGAYKLNAKEDVTILVNAFDLIT